MRSLKIWKNSLSLSLSLTLSLSSTRYLSLSLTLSLSLIFPKFIYFSLFYAIKYWRKSFICYCLSTVTVRLLLASLQLMKIYNCHILRSISFSTLVLAGNVHHRWLFRQAGRYFFYYCSSKRIAKLSQECSLSCLSPEALQVFDAKIMPHFHRFIIFLPGGREREKENRREGESMTNAAFWKGSFY